MSDLYINTCTVRFAVIVSTVLQIKDRLHILTHFSENVLQLNRAWITSALSFETVCGKKRQKSCSFFLNIHTNMLDTLLHFPTQNPIFPITGWRTDVKVQSSRMMAAVSLGNKSCRHGVTRPVCGDNDAQLSAAYLAVNAFYSLFSGLTCCKPARCLWMCGECQ